MSARLASLRIFAIVNSKGGVGKTTTALNLGAAWAELGKRVLLIDLDPSATLTKTLSVPISDDDPNAPSVYQLLRQGQRLDLAAVTHRTKYGLDIVPANRELAKVPFFIREEPNWGSALAEVIRRPLPYDVIVIDCPPESSIVFTYLALGAATDAIVVLQPEGPAVMGTGEMNRRIEKMRAINPALRHHRLVVNMFANVNLGRGMLAELRQRFAGYMCETTISRRVSVAEAMTSRMPVSAYEPRGASAESYRALARELLIDGEDAG